MLPHSRDIGMHLILTRATGGAARASYEPFLHRMLEMGTPGLVLQKGTKTTRGGIEKEFAKDLEEYGFEGFSDGDYSPDHVRDLDWGGTDSYGNLWPLERGTNAAAGRYHSFSQEVEFNLPDDPPDREPRKEKLSYEFFRGRTFKIKQVADPPS